MKNKHWLIFLFLSLPLMAMDNSLQWQSDEGLQCDCLTERMLHRRKCATCVGDIGCSVDSIIKQKYEILRAELAVAKKYDNDEKTISGNSSFRYNKDQKRVDERGSDKIVQ